jgi:hypothetical protein
MEEKTVEANEEEEANKDETSEMEDISYELPAIMADLKKRREKIEEVKEALPESIVLGV